MAGAQNAPSVAMAATSASATSTTAGQRQQRPSPPRRPARADRGQAPVAIGQAPAPRAEHPLHRGGDEEDRPDAAPEAPRSSIRSGTSTSRVPAKAPAAEQPEPDQHRAPRRAEASVRSVAPGSGAAAGTVHAHAPGPATTATPLNTTSGPTHRGRPAQHGAEQHAHDRRPQRRADHPPRRSEGVAHTSQARPPAHEHAPPTPWANRAASSSDHVCAKPKITLVIPSRPRPVSSRASRRSARPASPPESRR